MPMSRILAVTLLLVPFLISQQAQKATSSDCDKTAQTESDLTVCASHAYKGADDELNRIYQSLLKNAANDPVALDKIRAAQNAWVVFRDAQLAALYPAEDKQREYGTVFPMCANLALADLTRQRIDTLKHMLNRVEGDVCAGGSKVDQQTSSDEEHTEWISNVMRSIQTIKVGMNRSDLLKMFTTEGGLEFKDVTTSRRTYVHRKCRYIKVDVKLAIANPNDDLPTDKITEISRPYLDWTVAD
ncbi:MAG: DUF1311 domain-containing protein [Acidobacteria bacterium]|nr:DUF1311 domain-containing protein [Acidobacteriota bacterium]